MNTARAGATRHSLRDWLARLEARHPVAIDLGLERCGAVWQRLGAPRPGRQVITVAGTNGKGSTVAWTCAALDALGLRQGAYTSPHLLRFNERLRIGGEDIDDDSLVAAFEAVEAARGDASLTYFEFTTLACLSIMARRDLDVAVLEVGLGGRLDTVNLVDADLAVITPIGLDHQAFLGDDRETIGREKAGILRPGIPVVAGEARPPDSVLAHAAALGCRVMLPGRDFGLSAKARGRAVFRLGETRLDVPDPARRGAYQRANLAAALAAVLTLRPEAARSGAALSRRLESVRNPGRLQAIGSAPVWRVDVGHNPLGAEVIARALAEGDPGPCVLGMLEDKDAEGVARLLAPVVSGFLCAGLEEGARAQTGERLAGRVRQVVADRPVDAFTSVGDAMAAARAAANGSGAILVFGSFHTASAALEWLSAQGIGLPPSGAPAAGA